MPLLCFDTICLLYAKFVTYKYIVVNALAINDITDTHRHSSSHPLISAQLLLQTLTQKAQLSLCFGEALQHCGITYSLPFPLALLQAIRDQSRVVETQLRNMTVSCGRQAQQCAVFLLRDVLAVAGMEGM
jgi:hypothetical protein